jgi:hypothetical protein
MREKCGGICRVVASNRAPYAYVSARDHVVCERPPSGMAGALDSALRTYGRLSVAQGSGAADWLVVEAQELYRNPSLSRADMGRERVTVG